MLTSPPFREKKNTHTQTHTNALNRKKATSTLMTRAVTRIGGSTFLFRGRKISSWWRDGRGHGRTHQPPEKRRFIYAHTNIYIYIYSCFFFVCDTFRCIFVHISHRILFIEENKTWGRCAPRSPRWGGFHTRRHFLQWLGLGVTHTRVTFLFLAVLSVGEPS